MQIPVSVDKIYKSAIGSKVKTNQGGKEYQGVLVSIDNKKKIAVIKLQVGGVDAKGLLSVKYSDLSFIFPNQ